MLTFAMGAIFREIGELTFYNVFYNVISIVKKIVKKIVDSSLEHTRGSGDFGPWSP